MANIYMVRHGQSVANIEHKYQGQSYDTDLTELGKTQALDVGNKLQTRDIKIIYSSPLKRAQQTADIIATKLSLKVFSEDLLKETDHGDWCYLTDEQIKTKWPEMYEMWQTSPSQVIFPNGEDFQNQTAKRVVDWWQALDKNKNTVIVSHENIMQIIITFILGQSLDHIWEHRVKNGDVICLDSDNIEIC